MFLITLQSVYVSEWDFFCSAVKINCDWQIYSAYYVFIVHSSVQRRAVVEFEIEQWLV